MIDTLYLRKDDTVAARTDDYWRNHDMETIKTTSGEKTGYRICAAFNQHSAHATLG